MLLELYNFRCWRKKTFEFQDDSFILLSGSSGAGKTSILSAINFVLYGKGNKIITHGEKKCHVKMIFKHLEIKRTKSPRRLLLVENNKEYEDEAAQQIINTFFGENFELVSYMTQKMVNSFLNMTPVDKMNFLEKISLNDNYSINDIKRKTKDRIKLVKEQLAQQRGQNELLKKEFSELTSPEEVSFPLKGKYSPIKIKNEGVYWKRTLKSLKENTLKHNELCTEWNEYKILYEKRKEKELQLNEVSHKIVRQEEEKQKIKFEDNLDFLTEMMSYLSSYKNYMKKIDEYKKDKEIFEQLNSEKLNTEEQNLVALTNKISLLTQEKKKINFEDNLKELQEVLNYLVSVREYDKYKKEIQNFESLKQKELQDADEKIKLLTTEKNNYTYTSPKLISEYQRNLEIIKRYNTISDQLDTYKKQSNISSEEYSQQLEGLKKERQRVSIMSCPRCNCSLSIKDNVLVEVTDIPTNITLKEIELKINQCKKDLSKSLDFEKNIQRLKEEKDKILLPKQEITADEIAVLLEHNTKYEQIEKELSRLNKKELSSTLIQIEKKLSRVLKPDNEIDTDYTEDELNKHIYEQKLEKEKLATITSQLKNLQQEVKHTEEKIKDLSIQQFTRELPREVPRPKILKNVDIPKEEEVIKRISDQKIQQEKLSNISKRIQDLNKEKDILIQSIESLPLTCRDFEKENDDLVRLLEELNLKNKEHNRIDIELKKYVKYTEEKSIYDKWKSRVFIGDQEERKLGISLSTCETFLKKIQEAESISLFQTISTLNYYVNFYLEKFFSDPITIEIVPFKETKKDIKPTVDICIGYKGQQVDIQSLSGGEYDRVTLSIILSLNTIFNSQFLLLDESISSLDSELTDDILDVIKENCKKTVIIVAHQISSGIFDEVIDVSSVDVSSGEGGGDKCIL